MELNRTWSSSKWFSPSQSLGGYSHDSHRYGTISSSNSKRFDMKLSSGESGSGLDVKSHMNGWSGSEETIQSASENIHSPRQDDSSVGWSSKLCSDEFQLISSITDICVPADSTDLSDMPALPTDQEMSLAEANRLSLDGEHGLLEFDSEGGESFTDDDENNERAVLGDSSACNVCGDVVAGFHCGAYVCEACKKFFVRCLKQDAGSKFTCSQNNNCIITKETRTQCPRCRYQKCLKLGMYRPGGPNLSTEICHIPCKVCGAPSSGFHFGAITCEGCKGFFRRSVKERDCLKYQCTRDGSCTITWKTRNVCKMCRYNQCLRAGMKPDKSRIGRQPNAVKHATFLQLCRIKSVKGLTSPTDPFGKLEASGDSPECGRNEYALSSTDNVVNVDVSSSHNDRSDFGIKKKRKPYTRRSGKSSRDQSKRDSLPCVEVDSTRLCPSPWEIKHETESPPICDGEVIISDCADVFDYSVSNDFVEREPSKRLDSMIKNPPVNNQVSSDAYVFCGVSERPSGRQTPTDVLFGADCDSEPVDSGSGTSSDGKLGSVGSTSRNMSSLSYDDIIAVMKRAYYELVPILSKPANMPAVHANCTLDEVWGAQMFQFTHDAQATLKFAKKVPGFRSFCMEEQISMVQMTMFPIVVVVLSLLYDVEKHQYSWFMFTESERKIIFNLFHPFRALETAFHNLGQIIQELEPDETEVAFLCGLHLIDSGSQHIYKELLLDALAEYSKRKCGSLDSCRQAHILMCLRDMADANECHKISIEKLLSEPQFAQMPVPQLFKETFIGLPDSGEAEKVDI